MPREIVKSEKHDLDRSLGWVALWFIQTFLLHGPGDAEGEPVILNDEEAEFIASCYCLDENGRRLYDRAMLSRVKGWAKSEKGGFLGCFEAVGPCRFDGWARGGETFKFLGETYTYQRDEPMGHYQRYPFVRVLATEEHQTGQVYDTIKHNFDSGPLSELKSVGMDVGNTRILLPAPWGGEVRPSTAGAASKDGGKETFVVADESHLYVTNELRQMFRTVNRNLPKRGAVAEPWLLETTTMFQPGEESIAEVTFSQAKKIQEGKTRRARLYFDHRYATLPEKELADEKKLRAAVREAYGDALQPTGWVSEDSVVDKIYDPQNPPRDSMRYYLNEVTAASNAWVTPQQIEAIEAFKDECEQVDSFHDLYRTIIEPGEQITLGFDGSLYDDSTALVGCRVSDGLLFPILIDECPDGPEARSWMVDQPAFDAAVDKVFDEYDVVAFFADPPHWQAHIDTWEHDHGTELRVKSTSDSRIYFWTDRERPMVNALDILHTAIQSKSVHVLADPQLVRHLLNARVWHRRAGDVIGKERKGSPKKMDAAIASTLAFAARARFLREQDVPDEDQWDMPIRVY
jgi:hypothetical protein